MLAALSVAACGGVSIEGQYIERPVEQIYNSAHEELALGNYILATQEFDEVERQHPYSMWATKAQLMSAYAYYLSNRYDEAIIALDRFIRLHPTSKDTAYAYYLKGLSYYEQISDVRRDQDMTRRALRTLSDLVKRYPNSKYARDAKLKIDHGGWCRPHSAGSGGVKDCPRPLSDGVIQRVGSDCRIYSGAGPDFLADDVLQR